MKLTDLIKKPQLVKITLDEETIVKEYGEPLEFYTWDTQPIDEFLKFAQSSRTDTTGIMNILRSMVLTENGEPAIPEGYSLPGPVIIATVVKMVELMGK